MILHAREPNIKPIVEFDVGSEKAGFLRPSYLLSGLIPSKCYYEIQDRRHPLGVYNLSTHRICKNISKLCKRFEHYSAISTNLESIQKEELLREDIVDSIELCLYAAAEHVDDIEIIAACFFPDRASYNRSSDVKNLKRSIKPLRDMVSSFTNAIKHNQGRVRLFSRECQHSGHNFCLHAMFIEGISNGSIGPCPIIHKDSVNVVSIPSFLWSIIIYIGSIASSLSIFIEKLQVIDEAKSIIKTDETVRDAVINACRLPNYSFEEKHPFFYTKVVVKNIHEVLELLGSNIYGSLTNPWSKISALQFGQAMATIHGDGVSNKFTIPKPVRISLHHWD